MTSDKAGGDSRIYNRFINSGLKCFQRLQLASTLEGYLYLIKPDLLGKEST